VNAGLRLPISWDCVEEVPIMRGGGGGDLANSLALDSAIIRRFVRFSTLETGTGIPRNGEHLSLSVVPLVKV